MNLLFLKTTQPKLTLVPNEHTGRGCRGKLYSPTQWSCNHMFFFF